MPLQSLPNDDVYITYEDTYSFLQSHARNEGYVISIQWFKKQSQDKIKLIKVEFCCDQGQSIWESKTFVCQGTTSKRLDCSFKVHIFDSVAKEGWILKKKHDEHNHFLSDTSAVHAVHHLTEITDGFLKELDNSTRADMQSW